MTSAVKEIRDQSFLVPCAASTIRKEKTREKKKKRGSNNLATRIRTSSLQSGEQIRARTIQEINEGKLKLKGNGDYSPSRLSEAIEIKEEKDNHAGVTDFGFGEVD